MGRKRNHNDYDDNDEYYDVVSSYRERQPGESDEDYEERMEDWDNSIDYSND